MQWMLIILFLVSFLSLLSYLYCWQDIRKGRPHIISLRQVTSIMDRELWNHVLGIPMPGYYYPLTPLQMHWITKNFRWHYYIECAADIACMAGAWFFASQASSETDIFIFLILAGMCQGINIIYSLKLIRKWQHQIQEEIDNSES